MKEKRIIKNGKVENQKVVYYEDELKDEFSEAKIEPIKIDEEYKYFHKSPIWRSCAYWIQHIITVPFKFIYTKLKFKIKFIGKERLKQCKNTGYFVYANHTQPFADTFIPSNIVYPKRNFFIVNPENVSMRGLKTLVPMLGAIPIPSTKEAMKNFLDIIEYRINKKSTITIYPEAHIWPYYTGIRPFKSVSFKYPVKLEKPTFCITNTYQVCGKKKDKFRMVSYIDGPFYPDKLNTVKEKQENLRNKVYACMKERAKNSNVEFIKYCAKNVE